MSSTLHYIYLVDILFFYPKQLTIRFKHTTQHVQVSCNFIKYAEVLHFHHCGAGDFVEWKLEEQQVNRPFPQHEIAGKHKCNQ